jgi:acetaldehyde dehydrogenase (acetylating)
VADLDPDLRALQEVRDLVARAKAACEAIHGYDQQRTDALCSAMAKAAAAAAGDLGRLAVEETGIGRVHYKILKNLFGAEGTWASIRGEKTVGIISRDEKNGVIEVATPAGVIAGIIPTTNPTSTAIYKALIAVKGRNAIVISPHPRARRCIRETVEVMRRAIERTGGPPDLVSCLSNPTIESTGALMKHKDVALVLATGGSGLVQAAYSSGKPAYGVGPGNVPAYVDRSADVPWAAQAITASQSFDNGTLCCSEQGVVLDQPIAERFLGEMRRRGAYLADERETQLLGRLCNQRGGMNPDVVGLDPWRIAEMAGFPVPRHTTVLLAHQGGVGKDWPLSIEILAPILSVHTVDGWREGCRTCIAMLEFGGLGHTLAIYARDQTVLDAFFLEKPANRILVNGPASQGAVGYSTNLVPSMSLGCGPQAGNITSDNITARHLVNIKRVAYLKRDWADIERKDHARAAAMMGGDDPAPRGSGLPGDPALAAASPTTRSSAFAAEVRSNWQGNPAMGASAEKPALAPPSSSATVTRFPLRPPVQAAQKSAPTFARTSEPSGFGAGGAAVATLIARPATKANPYVGAALSPSEIQTLMQHAGSGCPLGPCKGCPHYEIPTCACTA